MKKQKGFSSLDILVVIALIGVCIIVVFTVIDGVKTKHRICDEYDKCYIVDSSITDDGCVSFRDKDVHRTICGKFTIEKFKD